MLLPRPSVTQFLSEGGKGKGMEGNGREWEEEGKRKGKGKGEGKATHIVKDAASLTMLLAYAGHFPHCLTLITP